jgi:nucleoside-diphosphate-sugar epimerase
MCPDWSSEEESEGGKPRAHRHPESDLPIIDQDEDDFEEDDDEFDEDGDDDEPQDEDVLDMEVESEPRTVLITGACGNIGRKLRAAWEEVYDLILLDSKVGPDDSDVFEADLSVWDEDWTTHFNGVDTVVHLAANSDETRPLEELIGPNLDAMANVFNAAALYCVDRLIFASSNHVMGLYKDQGDEPITVELPPRPGNPYGVFKLAGERLGKSLAEASDLTFIALRIGWVQEGRNRPETLPDDWSRQMWLSNHDLVQLFDAAVEAEIEDSRFVVVNGVSRNHGTRWDLTDAAEILGYLPEDDAYARHEGAGAMEKRQ